MAEKPLSVRWYHTWGTSPVRSCVGSRKHEIHSVLPYIRQFKQVRVSLRLPVKLVRKQLGLVHSMGCFQDLGVLRDQHHRVFD